jgi:ABC-type bacteriocin/lantibiotic exporter with double-glycine peptidase domain
MDVSKQINHNDCGICVINSFFKHFYKRDIKEELLQEANITQKGLSIFDFENLCIKHGMHSEVYQVDNNELKNLNHNGYFIVLLNKMDGRHYVIIRKKNKHIECIDSIDGFKIIDIENLIKDFSGIIIFIKKACYDFKITNNKIKLFKNINFKYLLINILLQVTIITFSIVGSNYFSFFINNSLVNNTYVNGLIISFLFLLIFVINELSKFLCNLLSNKQMKQNFYKLSNDFVEKIKDKDESFFYKINQNYLYLIDVIIKSIAAYNTIEFCNFIASCISIVVLFCVISSIGNLYAIICLIIILILGIFGFLKYKFKNNIFGKIIRNGVANSSISNKLINYLKYQHNQLNFKSIIENIKSNYSDYLSIQNISSKFNGFTNMILNITEKFILIITLTLTSFFFSDEIIYTKLFLLIMLLGIF